MQRIQQTFQLQGGNQIQVLDLNEAEHGLTSISHLLNKSLGWQTTVGLLFSDTCTLSQVSKGP